MYQIYKRLMDILISLFVIILLLPVFVIISTVIIIKTGFPVFYLQERCGKNWKYFKIIKFRTMENFADSSGVSVSGEDDIRITPIGKFLRKYKLDELPQFYNVFRGQMSIVGPRPEVKKYADFYPEAFNRILKVRPGISDFASIEYSNESEILKDVSDIENFYIKEILPHKMMLCEKYLNQMSLLTDMKIITQTIIKILY
jgi:lipopolysaccharide/colanic/teichoic acid biosynthesis glycosyltransferase